MRRHCLCTQRMRACLFACLFACLGLGSLGIPAALIAVAVARKKVQAHCWHHVCPPGVAWPSFMQGSLTRQLGKNRGVCGREGMREERQRQADWLAVTTVSVDFSTTGPARSHNLGSKERYTATQMHAGESVKWGVTPLKAWGAQVRVWHCRHAEKGGALLSLLRLLRSPRRPPCLGLGGGRGLAGSALARGAGWRYEEPRRSSLLACLGCLPLGVGEKAVRQHGATGHAARGTQPQRVAATSGVCKSIGDVSAGDGVLHGRGRACGTAGWGGML